MDPPDVDVDLHRQAVAPPRKSPRRPPPELALCVLGSGSGGNCTVLRHRSEHLLVDAGLGPRATARRLRQAGVALSGMRAVCITHFDADHFRRSWCGVLAELGIPLYCHHWHLEALARVPRSDLLFDAGLVEAFDAQPFEPLPGLIASTVRLQHDRQGTIGYRFDAWAGLAAGFATDLGHAPPHLLRHFAGVDLLCIESNYDEHMTIHSPRPAFVNRRNLSDSGHLSNDQAFAAVQRIGQLSPHGNPRRIALLHRSNLCNHPTKVARCFGRDPALARRMIQTQQRRRSRWLAVAPLKAVQRLQMPLAMLW